MRRARFETRARRISRPVYALVATLFSVVAGCTSLNEYIHNGCKVGPNYSQPPAAIANKWIDAGDKRIKPECDDLSQWWKVFNDPALDALICTAYHQNL